MGGLNSHFNIASARFTEDIGAWMQIAAIVPNTTITNAAPPTKPLTPAPLRIAPTISEKIARPAKNRNAVVNIREESMAAYLVT